MLLPENLAGFSMNCLQKRGHGGRLKLPLDVVQGIVAQEPDYSLSEFVVLLFICHLSLFLKFHSEMFLNIGNLGRL